MGCSQPSGVAFVTTTRYYGIHRKITQHYYYKGFGGLTTADWPLKWGQSVPSSR